MGMSMKAYKIHVNVTDDRRIAFTLPDDFPPGPAEVIVLAVTAAAPGEPRRVRVLGSLGRASPPPPPEVDPIAELHRARNPG
ncbi:hypothetical protein BE11_08240 [Sorangium cellulosum]|nr:hypothetical protein BE11_08240 [Sorangium cellulosum]